MRIAILGGGFTGLSAAWYLQKKGHTVTLFEREKTLGGLAGGFKADGWSWHLERTYHHLFSNDYDILKFAEEIGFEDIFFQSPETASLYEGENNYRIIPVDTPQDFLRFPLLSYPQKIRAAAVLAFLKFSPFLTLYERETAREFLEKYQGKQAWEVLWSELFRKKFGKYAGNIVMSFFWARITKRTKDLGYVQGGFQELINHAEKVNREAGVEIKKGIAVEGIEKRRDKFIILNGVKEFEPPRSESLIAQNDNSFDVVISTLPTPILTRLGADIFPTDYISRLQKIKYLSAMNLILETKEKVLDKTYWLSICTSKIPFMVAVQQTNFVDKKHYNNNNILYIGDYLDNDDKRLKMDRDEVLKLYLPFIKHMRRDNPRVVPTNAYLFKAPFAQPIFDKEFVKLKPDFETPVKNFFVANLDMTYPYDRGTNYAVKLGKDVTRYFYNLTR